MTSWIFEYTNSSMDTWQACRNQKIICHSQTSNQTHISYITTRAIIWWIVNDTPLKKLAGCIVCYWFFIIILHFISSNAFCIVKILCTNLINIIMYTFYIYYSYEYTVYITVTYLVLFLLYINAMAQSIAVKSFSPFI